MKTREGRTVRIGSARKGYRIWLTPTDAARLLYYFLDDRPRNLSASDLRYARNLSLARHAPVAPMGLVEVARRRRVDPLVRRALA